MGSYNHRCCSAPAAGAIKHAYHTLQGWGAAFWHSTRALVVQPADAPASQASPKAFWGGKGREGVELGGGGGDRGRTNSGLHHLILSSVYGGSHVCAGKITSAGLRRPIVRPEPLPQGKGQMSSFSELASYSCCCTHTLGSSSRRFGVSASTGSCTIGLSCLFICQYKLFELD